MVYMGGKARLMPHIKLIIESYLKPGIWYVEPFMGGLNSLVEIEHPKRLGADNNLYLVAMWKDLLNGEEFPSRLTRGTYDACRDYVRGGAPGIFSDGFVGWVGFISSYRGRFFQGYNGSAGGDRDYQLEAANNIRRQLEKFKSQTPPDLLYCDYEDLEVPPGSVIYCDPPYRGTKGYEKSTGFDYESFYDWCRDMRAKRACTVFISELEMPDDFIEVWAKPCKTQMCADGSVKQRIEKLFKI